MLLLLMRRLKTWINILKQDINRISEGTKKDRHMNQV